MVNTSGVNIRNIQVLSSPNHGLLINGNVWNCLIEWSRFQYCDYGIFLNAAVNQINAMSFRNCLLLSNAIGLRSITGTCNKFSECDISGNTTAGVLQDGGGNALGILNCYLERNAGKQISIDGQRAPKIDGCYLYGGAGAGAESDYAIELLNTYHASVSGNMSWGHNVDPMTTTNDENTEYFGNDFLG